MNRFLQGTVGLAFAMSASIAIASTANSAEPTRPFLTLDAAAAGAASCLTLAQEKGWRVAVGIVDRGGNLVHFARMDDTFVRQGEYAVLKAESASGTPVSTRKFGELVYGEGSPLRGLELIEGVTTVEGGEPIKTVSGYTVGAVGVSGAKPNQDGECARAAAAEIQKQLQ